MKRIPDGRGQLKGSGSEVESRCETGTHPTTFTSAASYVTSSLPDRREEAQQILYHMGFVAKSHLLLAESLLARPTREKFERVVRSDKHAHPEQHLQALQRLVQTVMALDMRVDNQYAQSQQMLPELRLSNPPAARALLQSLSHAESRLAATLPRFAFNWTTLEEVAMVAECIGNKMLVLLRPTGRSPTSREYATQREEILRKLEELVRMPAQDYFAACDRLKTVLKEARATKASDTAPDPRQSDL